jgi:hypothetical protein
VTEAVEFMIAGCCWVREGEGEKAGSRDILPEEGGKLRSRSILAGNGKGRTRASRREAHARADKSGSFFRSIIHFFCLCIYLLPGP